MGTQQYKAFLLRLQRNEGQPQWRATIENAQTGERIRFADQNQMLRYLLKDLEHDDRSQKNVNQPTVDGGV